MPFTIFSNCMLCINFKATADNCFGSLLGPDSGTNLEDCFGADFKKVHNQEEGMQKVATVNGHHCSNHHFTDQL